MNTSTLPLLIGIDGGDDGIRALRYGIEEARRRGCGVRLLHVVPELLPPPPASVLGEAVTPHHVGAQILKDALDLAHELAPELDIEGELAHGARLPALLDQAYDACCLVLGTREWREMRRVTGSTTARVAAHATCPVIGVPTAWQPGRDTGVVVVGVDAAGQPGSVLGRAFAEARARDARLLIVHSWQVPSYYEASVGWLEPRYWRAEAADALAEATRVVREENLDVPSRVVVEYDRAATTLCRHTADADLVVVGRHRGILPWPHWLGSVAHGLLHGSQCPVQILPVD